MSQKWIVETPSTGGTDELCIGRIFFEGDSLWDNDYKRIRLKYTIIWKPSIDDEHKVGKLQLCTDTYLPFLQYEMMEFNKKFIKDIDDIVSLYRLAIQSVFEFMWR